MGLVGSLCVDIYLPPNFSLFTQLSLFLTHTLPPAFGTAQSSQLPPSDLAHLTVVGIRLSPSLEFASIASPKFCNTY